MGDIQHQPAAANKANFTNLYNDDDPRAYLTTLAPLQYTIPQQVQPLFQRLYKLSRRDKATSAILDVCCSYGINGGLLKHDVNMESWTARYVDSELRPSEQVQADKEFFSSPARSSKPVVFGLDTSTQAIRYALDVNLIDAGWSDNLEINDPSQDLCRALRDVSLIICTGGAGYVGSRTFGRIMKATGKPTNVWVVSTVIRMVPYDNVAATLREYGLETEKLPGVVLRQRRFASAQEQADIISDVAARGLNTSGFEDQGYLCAEVYISRPAADVMRPPVADLVKDFYSAHI
ncbi:methyltransferase type 12 [Fusarium longipes]|uniref:Methyltransferase type 12 n=1 Tax=Fusarium longipes TaxID=694270 RepID=A0A395SXL2_9HYPO|nr:methyltransferase type 12 [Fusarium longipes]